MAKVKAGQEDRLLMTGDASLIYFCGERLLRDIAGNDLGSVVGVVEKVERACRNLREWDTRRRRRAPK